MISKRQLQYRHREEIAFHDRKMREKAILVRQKRDFYDVPGENHVYEDLLAEAGSFENKRALDVGCGEGWASAEYLKRGSSSVTAFDLSFESLCSARHYLRSVGFSTSVPLIQAAAEYLPFRDASFDLLICISTLHHTDLDGSLKEIHRVLAPGGKALLAEPLDHNFAINLFRKLTPWRRSKYEKPINIDDFLSKAIKFQTIFIRGYYLLSIFSLGFYFIHHNDSFLNRSLQLLYRFDKLILNRFPFLKRYCFAALIIMER